VASFGCPPGAIDTYDPSTGTWINHCPAYCKTAYPDGGDAQFACVQSCENNQACHPGTPLPISGAEVINSAITAGGMVPPNANCWAPMFITGPMNGADPGDKLFVGGGRMLGDGQLRNGEYLNLYTAQGVTTAFQLAGISANTVVSKNANAKPVQGVNIISDATGVASGAAFNYQGANNWVPYTPVSSTATGAALPIPGVTTTSTGVGISAIPGTTAGGAGLAAVGSGAGGGPVQIGGVRIYQTASQAAPRAAATSLASIMSSGTGTASTYAPGFGAFGRGMATTYSCGGRS
jgi:hypothetical protein